MDGYIILLFLSLFFVLNASRIDLGWEDIFGDNHSTTLPVMIGGNKSYLVITSYKANFMQAMDFCENIHMNLLTIENKEESDRVKNYVINTSGGGSFWSAGSRLIDRKTWLWITTGDVLEYTNWGSGEPNGVFEHCIAVERRGDQVVWNDLNCDIQMSFICERPLDERREPDTNPDQKNWDNVFSARVDKPNLDLLHFRGKDYYIPREYRGNYLSALDFCKAINMNLVTINSEEENDRLYKYIRHTMAGDTFWSSGTRLLDGKNWVWLPNAQPVKYTNWAPGEPSNVLERCLQLLFVKNKGLIWNDVNCVAEFKVICEKPSNREISHDGTNDFWEEEDGEYGESDDVFYKKVQEMAPGSIETVLSGGKKFYVSRTLLATPSQARSFCEYHRMKLLDIKNEEESFLILKIIPYPIANAPFWVDGEKSNNTWLWKSKNQPIKYFNWQKGSPNNQDCLGVGDFGKYIDYNCKKRKPFICESETDENPIPKNNDDAIVNVFMINNLITEKGRTVIARELISSHVASDPEKGYHVAVNNDMSKC